MIFPLTRNQRRKKRSPKKSIHFDNVNKLDERQTNNYPT